jgi:hypothetical protein
MYDNNEYRLLVCGGRTYGMIELPNRKKVVDEKVVKLVYAILDRYKKACEIVDLKLVVIQGGALGADFLAKSWANDNDIEMIEFPVDWAKHGNSAGFIRNTEMLKVGKPNKVLAFPGGAGTDMMVDIAKKGGVNVERA